jgi:SAM-dependent methyltransferase
MDAEHLSFPDASFDVVVAQYVITTVPNPEATLDEFARVLKPGGEIVLVSRVGAEAGMRRALERWFSPAARKLGWRSDFSWERYARWARASHGITLVERRALPPFGHFSLSASPRSARWRSRGSETLRAARWRRCARLACRGTLSYRLHRLAITPPWDCNREQDGPPLNGFLEALRVQRWDDHRYYHHSRINRRSTP